MVIKEVLLPSKRCHHHQRGAIAHSWHLNIHYHYLCQTESPLSLLLSNKSTTTTNVNTFVTIVPTVAIGPVPHHHCCQYLQMYCYSNSAVVSIYNSVMVSTSNTIISACTPTPLSVPKPAQATLWESWRTLLPHWKGLGSLIEEWNCSYDLDKMLQYPFFDTKYCSIRYLGLPLEWSFYKRY